jgi:hypothetical protein
MLGRIRLPISANGWRASIGTQEWATIWNGLLERYKSQPTRPHSVYEAFIRADRGYVPMIVMATSPEGTFQVRGMLYSCGIKTEVPERDCIEALHRLGASACTQWLAQATGDPGYFVKWEKPPKF